MRGVVAKQLRRAADFDREVYRHIKKVYKSPKAKAARKKQVQL